jgi:uncharacterized protein
VVQRVLFAGVGVRSVVLLAHDINLVCANACDTIAQMNIIRSSMSVRYHRTMGFDQYHEPPSELSEEVRTFARMITSVIEEAEAISWYEQRIQIEKDSEAKAIMQNAQQEEFKHFGMDLEFLLRKKPVWRKVLQGILFQPGDIVENGEKSEDAAK